jgi:hypothetical protein
LDRERLSADEFAGFVRLGTASIESKAQHAGLDLAPVYGQRGIAAGKDGTYVRAACSSASSAVGGCTYQ